MAVQLYRSHFKTYFQVSLIANLWSFVPVFGWAKLVEMLGCISRLAFYELSQQPESPENASKATDPLKWRFLWATILVGLYYMVAILGFSFASGIIIALLASASQPLGIVIGIILVIIGIILFIRLSCRLFIYDTAIAIEESASASASISRSKDLTKGFVGKIQGVVVISFIIVSVFTVPVQILRAYVQIGDGADSSLAPILLLLLLGLSFLSNAVVLPFWQVIKAVIYFDLRTRREGYGLNFREQ